MRSGRVDSGSGGSRGLADTALLLGQAQRVRSALRDDSEVGGGGAHVLPGQVATTEVDHEVPEVEEQCAPVRRLEDGTHRQREHRFGAAVRQVGQGALVGHRLGQAQGVVDTVLPARVAPEPDPAGRGPAHGRVDRDDHGVP